jgi:predicted Zn-dependent protease
MNSFGKAGFFPAFLLALMVLITTPALSYAENLDLPDFGSTADAIMSVDREKRLGKEFMRSVRQYLNVVDDPVINGYIQALGSQLTSQIGDFPFEFTFFVIDAPSINAFAGPAGHIGIHTGTILSSESESELASVVAHEIAHVTQRHLQRSMEKANNLSLPTAAAMIAALIIGSQDVQAGTALLMATTAGSTQAQINFTRMHEKEADRVGMELLASAGFDPRAMPIFFEHLQKKTRMYSNAFPEFLSTHPITLNRISDSRNRAEQYPVQKYNNSTSFHIIHSTLQVESSRNPEILPKYFESSLKSGNYRNEFAQEYGYTLALLKNEQFDQARDSIKSLIAKDSERVPYLLTQAQVEINTGNQDVALDQLANALKLYPHNTPLTILYAKTLLDNNQPEKSKKLLQAQIRHNALNPVLYKLLAIAEEQTSSKSAAYQALAEYDYLNGRTRMAINHLQMALKENDSKKYAHTRIEARLKVLKEEVMLQQHDKETE